MTEPTGFLLLADALVEVVLDTLQKIQVQENIGLGNVDDTSDVNKPVSTAQAAAISGAVGAAIAALTKASVGLANVDNTSDVGKPVSTAQATAIGLKVAKAGDTMTGFLVLHADPDAAMKAATKQYVDALGALKAPINNAVFTGTTTLAADPALALQAATKQYVDATVNALLDAANAEQFKGLIDASANPNYPAASSGWVYKISVAGKVGGASGIDVEIGDRVQCITDGSAAGNQATVGANWWITQANVGFSSNGISLVTAATYAAMKTLLAVAVADITDASANGRSLISAANYAAMKTLLAYTVAGITDMTANGRSLVTAADYAAMKVLLAVAAADITDASANGRSLITAANYAAMKTLLSLNNVANSDATNANNLASGTVPTARMPASASTQATPADPAATTSTAGVMMGLGLLGCTITPGWSGRVRISWEGNHYNGTNTNSAFTILRYGTGTAPSYNAAAVGTTVGKSSGVFHANPSSSVNYNFSRHAVITGLTPGVPVWFDLQFGVSVSGSVGLQNVGFSANEG